MALKAYVGTRTCPGCGQPVEQSDTVGREKIFHNSACKMRYHRRKSSECLWCKNDGVRPIKAWWTATVTCWKCGAVLKYSKSKKQWTIEKNGKQNMRAVPAKK